MASMALQASISRLGLLILNSAFSIWAAKEPPAPPSVLMKGKTGLLDVLERLVGRKLRPVRPAEIGVRKNGRELLAAEFGGTLCILLALVEALEEEQKGQLLDGVEGIGQPAGP